MAGGADHHRFGLPFHVVVDLVPEVLDDDLGSLRQVLGMQGRETGQSSASFVGLVLGIVKNRFLQVEVPLVGEVVGQHVLDKALLDGLAHRVQVEGLMLAVPDPGHRTAPGFDPWGWR